MATKIWRGDAQGVAQVDDITVSNVEVGDVFTVTINRKDVSYTATKKGATEGMDDVIAGLAAAINASTIDEFEKITATALDTADEGDADYGFKDTLRLTGGEDGEPFTATVSSTDAGAKEVSVTTVTTGSAATNEKQKITLPGPPTGGTFTLSFEGYTTAGIAYNASAATVETAFEGLTSVGAGNGTVTGDAGGPWTIEFTGSLAGTDVSLVTGSGSSLTGGADIEVTETTTGGSSSSNEKWTLTLGTVTPALESANITIQSPAGVVHTLFVPFSSSTTAADIQSSIDANSNLVGNISVSGSAGGPWTLEWIGTWAGQTHSGTPITVNGVTATAIYNGSPVTPDDYAVAQSVAGGGSATDEVQVVTLLNGPTGGDFTLTFEGDTSGVIAWNASAAAVETELELMTSLSGGVTVTGNAGGPWTITFDGTGLTGRDVQLLTYSASGLTGSNVTVTKTQDSVAAVNEVQQVTLTGDVTGGTYTLTWDPGGGDETTGTIDYDATSDEVQTALEGLTTPTSGDFSVTGVDGGPWLVEFTGTYAATDVNEMSGSGSGLTGAGTQTISLGSTTSPTGPNWVDNADNWHNPAAPTTPTAPVNSDTVIFAEGDVDALWGLDQLNAVTLTELHIYAGYTGRIGLAQRDNADDVLWEYRPTYFEIGATTIKIGEGDGAGSSRIKLDTAAVQADIEVLATGVGEDADLPAVRWKGTHASNAARVLQGEFGVAIEGGESATLLTLEIGYRDSEDSDASVVVGEGVTLTTVTKHGGELLSRSGATTLTQFAGETEWRAGAVANLTQRGGLVGWHSSGALGKAATITGVTAADPAVVTATAHGLATGDRVRITGVAGMTELNGNTYTIEVVNANSFNLVGVDSSAYTAYSTGGAAALLGSVLVAGDAVLNFEGSPVAKTVSAPITVLGSDASVHDRGQTVSGLIVDVHGDVDEDGQLRLGRSYRLERAAAEFP